MKKTILLLLLSGSLAITHAQSVGIGTATPHSSAQLDISSTSKGLLIPRMSANTINNISSPARGLMVYDTVTNQLMVNMGTSAAKNWQTIASNSNWNLGGNSGINVVTQFVGTNDNRPLRFRVNGILAGELSPALGNIFWGLRAGETNTTGYSNIAIGTDALKRNSTRSNLVAIGDSALFNNSVGALSSNEAIYNVAIGSKSLYVNTKGSFNTATGSYSLHFNSTGHRNTANGMNALYFNSTGYGNTSTGFESLLFNSTGYHNTAVGFQSLFSNNSSANTAIGASAMYANISGSNNTAAGFNALRANIEGYNNTATGSQALSANTIGNYNTASGYQSLVSNTSGSTNTAVGNASLFFNSTGSINTAVGNGALFNNTSGSSNVAIGERALAVNTGDFGNRNTAVGVQTLHATTSSQYNTALGYFAGNLVNLGYNNTFIGANSDATFAGVYNSIAIGESARVTGSSQARIGNTSTISIGGQVGWSSLSDGRFKKNIREDVKGIEFIMKLRPVTYQVDIAGLNSKLSITREKNEATQKTIAEQEKTILTGFVAQEVEQAAKELGYDFSGVDKPKNKDDMYGLRYAEFVVPLVKAIQEQQVIIKSLQLQVEAAKAEIPMEIGKQQKIIEKLQQQVDELLKKNNAKTEAR